MRTLSELINSDDAVSEVVGYILIVGMIVTMVGLIYMSVMPSVEKAQEQAYIESIKRGVTVLDSRASMVALGESPSQYVNIDSKGGIFMINETASHISIIMNGTAIPIFNGDLGTFTYELDDTVVAYEGGGVWMKHPNGESTMLSPPEFHYNGETLTLPIIRLRGNTATSGTGTVSFKLTKDNSEIRFPNPAINNTFINPVAGSRDILITVHSDYYKAWARYMDERTEVHGITTNDSRREVSATLNIKPSDAAQDMNKKLIVYEIDDTVPDPIKAFKFNLKADQLAPGLNPLGLKFQTDVAINPQLIIEVQKQAGPNTYVITITYEDDFHVNEEWQSAPIAGALLAQEFDLLSNDIMTLTKPNAAPKETLTWGSDQYAYDGGVDYKGGTVMDKTTLKNVTQHYMSIMPAPFEFKAYQNNGKVDMANSTVVLNYAVAPPRLTYLHIVAHDISVGMD